MINPYIIAADEKDKAIIFGPKDKGSLLDADDIAKKTHTISYEVMTSVSSRVKRYII